jgi:uncharacterized peroxidase-related enzyme
VTINSGQETIMSTLPLIDPAAATGDAAALLGDVQAAFGVTPNMTKVMANSPAVLRGYLALTQALSAGVLAPGVREQIAVAIAELNGCAYCLSAHFFIGERLAGVDLGELERARHAESEDPHAAAILRVASAVARGRGNVGEGVLADARRAGVTDDEIVEVVAHVATNVLTNYLNILSEVEIDWPVVRPHEHAA